MKAKDLVVGKKYRWTAKSGRYAEVVDIEDKSKWIDGDCFVTVLYRGNYYWACAHQMVSGKN